MIIYRYIKKEVILTTLAITVVAVFIFMCNLFARYMSLLVSGKYAMNVIMHLVLLELPILFGVFLPFGLYLGYLVAFGRMYGDSEMVILKVSGFDRRDLLKIAMKIAVIVAIVVTILVAWIMPIANKHRDKIILQASANSFFKMLTPGKFLIQKNGNQIVYINKMAPNRKHVHNVFVAEKSSSKNNLWTIFTAKSGRQYIDTKTGDNFIVAENGYRYRGKPGQNNFSVMNFGDFGMRINSKNIPKPKDIEVVSTYELIKNITDKKNIAELEWRLSFPISVFLLAFIALPLSEVRVRQGRFGQLFPAVLIYIFYINCIFASRNWLESGTIPIWMGMLWVHATLLFLGFFLWWKKT